MALVVLLRGVNVGGHRTFRPRELAARLRHLDAVNLGAAGTFVIRRPVPRTQLRDELRRHLPFDTEIMICDGREFLRSTARSPLAERPAPPGVVRFVSVLSRRPRTAPALPAFLPSEDRWWVHVVTIDGRFVFGLYRRDLRVVRFLGELDRVFGVPATTRNWNTITAISAVLRPAAS